MTGVPLIVLAIVVVAGICNEVGRRASKRPPVPRWYRQVVGDAYDAMRLQEVPVAVQPTPVAGKQDQSSHPPDSRS